MQELIFSPLMLPTLGVGETIYSWCASVHRRTCSLSSIAISQALFGHPYVARQHDFSGHIGELCRRTAGLLGGPEELVLHHSLLGYFLAFAPKDRSSSLLVAVVNSRVPDIKMRLGILGSGVPGYHPLKGCRQCWLSDVQTYGWPIWHLEHQLPSVLVCRRHQRPLVFHWDPLTPVRSREWVKPSEGPSPRHFEVPIVDEQTLVLLLRLAEFSVTAAAMPPSSIQGDGLARTYQTWAAKNSGMSSGHCLRHPIMIRELKPAFDRISSSLLAMGPVACNLHLDSLIGAVVRNKPRPAHPLKHLALIACMYENWDEFWSCYSGEFSLPREPRKTALFPKKCSQEPCLLAQFIQLVQASNFSIRYAAFAVGVSESTGYRWAKAKGLVHSSRARKLTPDLVDQVCQTLRRGCEKTEVLRRTKISSASLNSLLASDPALRVQWRQARLEHQRCENREKFLVAKQLHPELPLWLLRKLPDTGWVWLYRHDKEWLASI